MHIPWSELELFLAVAEAGSFSKAAHRLAIEQPTVSRRFLALEERVGGRLCERGVGGITLTARGEKLLPFAQRMADWAGEASGAIAADEVEPEGVVRIAAPPGIAFDFLAPFALLVRKKLPQVTLEVRSGIDYLNLSRNEADLALRQQPSNARDLVTLFQIPIDAAVYCAQSYKKTKLEELDWIAWPPSHAHIVPNPQLAAMIPDWKPVFTSDDFLVQLAACFAGVGCMILSKRFHRFTGIDRLKELPIPLGPRAASAMYVVCSKRMAEVPRIAAVARLLRMEVKA